MQWVKLGWLVGALVLVECAVAGQTRVQMSRMDIMNRPFKSQEVAERQLKQFAFDFDPRSDALPTGINPDTVGDFIRHHLHPDHLESPVARQLAELADFYDLRQLVPDFEKKLARREATEDDFLVSLVFVQVVGVLAEGPARDQGRDYFNFLLSTRFVRHRLTELLLCWNAYTPPANTGRLTESLNRLAITLQAEARLDPAADLTLRNVQDLHHNLLPRLERASTIKQEIMTLPEIAPRLDRLVAIYLKLSMSYQEFLNRWAVRMLLREYRLNGATEPVNAFWRAVASIDLSNRSAEEKQMLKIVCYRAIDFLGGPVSQSERTQSKSLYPHLAGLLSLDQESPP